MSLNIEEMQLEIANAPLTSPWPLDVAIAVVNDCFRLAGRHPVETGQWKQWQNELGPNWVDQISTLAHFLAMTTLRKKTVEALSQIADRRNALPHFFRSIKPLTAEMMRSNRFRQEETLRKWAAFCRLPIHGETATAAKARMEELDYGKTLAEYKRAEAARKRDKQRRQRLLKEAQERAAAARGWRE